MYHQRPATRAREAVQQFCMAHGRNLEGCQCQNNPCTDVPSQVFELLARRLCQWVHADVSKLNMLRSVQFNLITSELRVANSDTTVDYHSERKMNLIYIGRRAVWYILPP